MSDVRTWLGACGLVVLLACTVGEAPPQSPPPTPGPAPEAAEPPEGAANESDAAAELVDRTRAAYATSELEEALELARQVMAEHPRTGSAADARWIGARAAFALGRYEEARELAVEHAREVREGSAAEEARSLAELAADAQREPAPAVVGAVLPRTGPRVLVRYADWLLEGIELAVAEAERAQNRRIELVVADDGGGSRVGEAVRELERRGAVAIIGPILADQIAVAAASRSSGELVLVSPTSSGAPGSPESYSINSGDALGARELGRYAADVGLSQAAMLYARTPDAERKAAAFAEEFEALGGRVRAWVAYDSGTTTFAPHMREILAAVSPARGRGLAGESVGGSEASASGQQPFALFVAAPARDVPQIAPQLGYYGLDVAGLQLFGDEAWTTAAVRRVVPNRDLEGAIAASRFPPERSEDAADPDFIRAYEARYRKSLNNQLPALGYDAAHLVMQALPNRSLTPASFARRFRLLAGIRGATGELSVRSDRVVRRSYLVVIRDGALDTAPYPWDYQLPEPRR